MPSSPAPTAPPDPRVHAYRPDLADNALKGRVEAGAYSAGTPGVIRSSTAPIREAPDPAARQASEALFGERLTVFDRRDGWAWVQMGADRYVGYVEAADIVESLSEPDHRVVATRALVFADADLKAAITGWLPLTAAIHVDDWRGDYARLGQQGWTHRRWIDRIDTRLDDPVATAERFLGAPYGWGGRTIAGLDCSGLVQVSLQAAGIACPRDTDQQARAVGRALGDDEPLKRGDIIFFPGHVGLMVDGANLLHANATHMAVTMNPLDEVVEIVRRGDSQGRSITARRRLPD